MSDARAAPFSPTLAVHEHPDQRRTAYERHLPEETVLYRVFQAEWRTFLAELEAGGEPPVLPAFVVAEVETFLRCGILAHGLVLASAAIAAGAERSPSRVSDGDSARAASDAA